MEGLAELAVKSTALTTVECDLVFRNDFMLIPDCNQLAFAADEARRAVWLLRSLSLYKERCRISLGVVFSKLSGVLASH
jgi:hypothetical protein